LKDSDQLRQWMFAIHGHAGSFDLACQNEQMPMATENFDWNLLADLTTKIRLFRSLLSSLPIE
jgi:hypothetical protein